MKLTGWNALFNPDGEPIHRRRSLRRVLALALLLAVSTMVIVTLLAAARLKPNVEVTAGALSLWAGTAKHSDRECGEATTTSGFENRPAKGPRYIYVHYMRGDEFIGPGDDAWTDTIERDIVSPPLKDGDKVSFKLGLVGEVTDLRRDQVCTR